MISVRKPTITPQQITIAEPIVNKSTMMRGIQPKPNIDSPFPSALIAGALIVPITRKESNVMGTINKPTKM